MGVLRVALVLGLLGGCQWALALKEYPVREDAGGDTGDAGPAPHACLGRLVVPAFCADFDELPDAFYVDNLAQEPPKTAATTTVVQRGPSATGPNALWFTTGKEPVIGTYTSTAKQTKVIDATFSLKIATVNGVDDGLGLVRLTLSGNATRYVNLELDQATFQLRVQSYGAVNDYKPIATNRPLDWVKVHFVYDAALGHATVSLDGSTAIMINATVANEMVNPGFQFGIDSTSSTHDGLSVGFDDITVL
jgi:hypothetical protein